MLRMFVWVAAIMVVAGCANVTPEDIRRADRVVGCQSIEQGEASYYADKFNGRRTASGERFSNNEMTAAHRTLPFGTMLRVTNQANGRSVVLRVNDRGPFIKGRIVDVSKTAAREIGMIGAGVAPVTLCQL